MKEIMYESVLKMMEDEDVATLDEELKDKAKKAIDSLFAVLPEESQYGVWSVSGDVNLINVTYYNSSKGESVSLEIDEEGVTASRLCSGGSEINRNIPEESLSEVLKTLLV